MNFQKSVLIVDDHVDTAVFLKSALKQEGFFALVATSALEALEALEKESCPDLILLDLSMPHIGGSEFMEVLKSSPKFSKIKVLIVSGWDNLAQVSREIGAHGYLKKPVEISALMKEINRVSMA